MGSKLSWSNFPRVCTWGKFQDKKAGKKFYLFNTHLDYNEQDAHHNSQSLTGIARVSQMQIILRKIREISKLSDPVFITGGEFGRSYVWTLTRVKLTLDRLEYGLAPQRPTAATPRRELGPI